MHLDVPAGARPVARVLVIDAGHRLLLHEARDDTDRRWWVAPGGGLEPGETFEAAARREVEEETGLVVEVGPWVWTRRHQWSMNGRSYDQYERFFVALAIEHQKVATKPDSYVVGDRWWSLSELQTSTETFSPRRLAVLILDIIEARYPLAPIDCGV